jgi:hypothetical protein
VDLNRQPDPLQDTAQICPNGHVITATYKRHPEDAKDFCPNCGERTMTTCPKCEGEISGRNHRLIPMHPFVAPAYCDKCGNAYPWTDKRLDAAKAFAHELELSTEDQAALSSSLDDLVKDTPQTPVAIERFKRLTRKAGPQVGEAFRSLLVDVLSQAITKQIWPH